MPWFFSSPRGLPRFDWSLQFLNLPSNCAFIFHYSNKHCIKSICAPFDRLNNNGLYSSIYSCTYSFKSILSALTFEGCFCNWSECQKSGTENEKMGHVTLTECDVSKKNILINYKPCIWEGSECSFHSFLVKLDYTHSHCFSKVKVKIWNCLILRNS